MHASSVIGAMFLVSISIVPVLNYQVSDHWFSEDYSPDLGLADLQDEQTRSSSWLPTDKRTMKGLGVSCRSTIECYPGLCCIRDGHIDTCQMSSMYGEKCSLGQIKGGIYHKHGPCYYGDEYCIDGTCFA
uniref:Putative tick ixodegrin n=1 Tax=Rhipicephalus microplus TaxID=6941 RepID=A0A6G5A411_RHIMP